MKTPQDQKPLPPALRSLYRVDHMPTQDRGNTLLYILVLLLIFSVLGVTMVSLFTTSSTSSATPNDARRALYMAESGIRYALSELRNNDFKADTIEALNATTNKLNTGETFELNVFSLWFRSPQNWSIPSDGTLLTLNIEEGKIPDGLSFPTGNIFVVNIESAETDIFGEIVIPAGVTTSTAVISSYTIIDVSTINLNLGDDFILENRARACLAVHPLADQSPTAGASLDVHEAARFIFPRFNGAVAIKDTVYFYEKAIYHAGTPGKVELTNLSDSVTIDSDASDDFIILWPTNHIIIPTGTSGTVVTSGSVSPDGAMSLAMALYDPTDTPGSIAIAPDKKGAPDADFPPILDTTNIAKIESVENFIVLNDDDKTLNIGGGVTAGATKAEFGAAWYKGDQSIGGNNNFTQGGISPFGLGVRVFFTLDYTGTADGLTFALFNAAHNATSSIGGDINSGELLGYAGDSRTVVDPDEPTAATDFLDAIGAGEDPPSPGLHPPKIALEFDTFTNNSDLAYCNAGAFVDNNRNDPLTDQRDALQHVFWGDTSLAMPCRDYTIGSTTVVDHPTYDDNRHDSGDQVLKWSYLTSGAVRSTPAVANDGSTIYVGSDDHWLYAIDAADGSFKWKFDTKGKVNSSPVVGPGGMVYVGSDGGAGKGLVYGFNPTARLSQPNGSTLNASTEWVFETPNNVDSSPAIGADGTVYIGDERGHFYALYPASRLVDPGGNKDSLNATYEWEFTDPGFRETSRGRPAIGPALDVDSSGNRQRIYITSLEPGDNTLYALDPADRLAGETFPGPNEWSFDTGDESEFMPAADPSTGVIYTDELGNEIRALFPDGTSKWVTAIGTDGFTPVVGEDGIVYVAGSTGASTGKLTALDKTTGNVIWEFTDSGILADVRTTPAIAPDGTIYFGSGDGLLHAVNPDGTNKWTFPIPVDSIDADGHSSPTVGDDGVVYIGSSSDDNLYAINNFAVPRNIKHQYVTSVIDGTDDTVGGEIVTVDDDINWLNGALTAGPWAVRLEAMRSLSQNADLKYEYTLHAWIRQCATDACENIFGTYYENTRIQYSRPPHLSQTIELTQAEHDDFATFIFGWTGATSQNNTQSAEIANPRRSFIRADDPIAP